MAAPALDLQRLAIAFAAGDEPVSFVDAFHLIKYARRVRDLDDATLRALLTLLEATHLTDGGKRVLGDFLRGVAKAQAQERALAARVFEPKDSDKTARAKAGATLLLAPYKTPSADATWSVIAKSGPGELEQYSPARAHELGAPFGLKLLRPGIVTLELAQIAAPGATKQRGPSAAKPAAIFKVRVIVEGD